MQQLALFKKIMFALLAFAICSCKNNFEQVKQLNQFDALPVGEADTIRVVYTDSAQTLAILTAPKNLDYTNQPFRVRTLVARDYAAAFEKCDVIASPTSPVPGFKLGERINAT